MKKLNTVLLVFSILIPSLVFAYKDATINEAPTPEDSPVKTIQVAIIKLNQLTSVATYSPQMMGFLINQEITPLFDFEYIADEVLSASYVSLSDEEVKYFSNSLKQNVINTLLVKLAKGRSRSLDFVYARPMRGGNIIVVRLNAKGYSRYGFNVDLSFHKNKSGKWKIFDVALENDSLINYYQRMILIKVRRYGIYGMLGKI
ncbi:hypothetical protein [uncultured Gammaproteobacteria bacterium]|jgi:phospholipid transport system substrate-binding protein|uniref:Uncharacterized protein n=3 Tax=sulfur-oxidizing symbionts TaxID=32036 RepID=A0ACA8ZNJ9_9GAMM|nr:MULTISPECIES: ABC transporter substrate-binding protein [sulfur-oxidizing symbionts]CAC9426410.1 hypothetical protein [uncultured Gammaproteobacteria bacterium]CAB5497114.1 hypothetical protein AZO1586R_545 [Bathymodiolus azoricus thioautotrophic gill symbiont]CAB5497242.1 hypothetical protein AZO1586I_140 [Bathymodiolus thermophilus thioautotrophic gill symbiont]CAC9499377.1 hypothetical protein [uncultured Gammaproteobacteria bacterium]CAC9499683.1 hypothetical protein [uncultured Gammapr